MNHLYRSSRDKKLFGVCGGIAKFLKIDSTLVRIGVVSLTIFTGVPILLYFLMAFIMPKEPNFSNLYEMGMNDMFGPEMTYSSNSAHTHLDYEIDRLEKRAMQEEIYRLRAELAKRDTF